MADRRGQVAHTRGSGEAVASTRSEEQRMAIIFLLPWLEELEKCDSCTEKCCPPIMRGSVARDPYPLKASSCMKEFREDQASVPYSRLGALQYGVFFNKCEKLVNATTPTQVGMLHKK